MEIIEINFIQAEILLDTVGFDSDFGLVSFPDSSEIQSYHLAADYLKDSILVVAPDAFQLSLSPDFTYGTDTLVFENDRFNTTEIFVRFIPNEEEGEFFQGNIIHFSHDADTVLLPLRGQEGTFSLSSIASTRDKSLGERVKIQGVVTGGNNHFQERRMIQDETAGIAIQGFNSAFLNFGDSVEVNGVLTEKDGWLCLIPEMEISTLSSDSIVVNPILKSISEIDASLESQRVRIEAIDIIGEGLFNEGEFFIMDENSDSLIFKLNTPNHPLVGSEIPFGKVNVTGFIGRRNNEFMIYPEFGQDLEIIPRDTILNIEAPNEGLDFGNIFLDEFSEPQFYKIQAENLPENLKLSASENFEVSLLENSNYANALELPINERGDIPEIRVYVRFSPITAEGEKINGEIVHMSGGQQQVIPLRGVEEIITSNLSLDESKILIFPNPVQSELKIELLESGNYQYRLIGLDGSIILKGSLNRNNIFEFDQVKKGIYLLEISSESKNYHFRIMKK